MVGIFNIANRNSEYWNENIPLPPPIIYSLKHEGKDSHLTLSIV
mgnify:CR=1 FL=1